MGWLKLTNPVVVGPMAGVTDSVFRHLAWEQGPALMWTEMISAQAILYRNYRTLKMAALHDCEGPVVIQIFGKEPAIMAEAAKNIVSFGPAAIDINMGCPAPKIVRNGEGAALSLKPQLAAKIVAAVSNAVDIPVMVKIRSGWDNDTINAVTLADRLARNGAAAVTVHGRTRSQFYSGKADLEIIKQVKEAVPIAVVGNGDIFEPEDALTTSADTTGLAGILIDDQRDRLSGAATSAAGTTQFHSRRRFTNAVNQVCFTMIGNIQDN